MTLDAQLAADIARQHYVEHFAVDTIAAQLQVHPVVVRRILKLPPKGRAGPARLCGQDRLGPLRHQ